MDAHKNGVTRQIRSPIATRAASRPSTSSSTPIQDTRKVAGNKLSDSLWPSTMRNPSVSFQSHTCPLPTNIDKPERMQSPRTGKHATDQSHNSKPVDSLVDQHRWPSTTSIDLAHKKSKISSSCSVTAVPNTSLDLAHNTSKTLCTPSRRRLSEDATALHTTSVDKFSKSSSFRRLSRNGTASPNTSFNPNVSSLSCSGTGIPSFRRASLDVNALPNRSIDLTDKTSKTSSSSSPRIPSVDETSKPLNKSTSDLLKPLSRDESGKTFENGCSVDDSSDTTQTVNSVGRPLSIPTLGLFPLSSLLSRWTRPSKEKLASSSRLPSPTRLRPSSPTKKLQTSNSVLSFLTDIKLLKRTSSHIEDVHHLQLLYNRLLQWRYANAQSDAALQSQKVKTEEMLCSVWMNIAALWDSISEKRVEIQRLSLRLKLYSILDNQIFDLEDWALTETDHVSSLSLAIQDLQANTVGVPVGDIENIKAAVWSAVEVMQATVSSLSSTLSKVDRRKWLADLVIQSRCMFDEYESVLGSILALQVEENSLRSHLLQIKRP